MRLTLLFLFLASTGFAQVIDNTASFRAVDADRFLRIHYENDFFTATDYYYSQGINMEFVHTVFNKFFLNKILLKGKEAQQMGIAFEHNGFTPTSTDSDSILYGDRPYAATLTGRVFSTSRHKSARITSSFSLGVIGPAAGGKAMQSTIHQWIDDDQPKGWENQIQNDIALKYTASIECNVLYKPDRLLLNSFASAQLGTLNTKTSGGITLIVGKLHSRLTTSFGKKSAYSGNRNFTFHGYVQPLVNFVAYDATLQGGLFNKNSPYTLPADKINRVTLQANLGLVMQAGPMYLEYFVTYISKEFNTGLEHAWGGVRVGVRW